MSVKLFTKGMIAAAAFVAAGAASAATVVDVGYLSLDTNSFAVSGDNIVTFKLSAATPLDIVVSGSMFNGAGGYPASVSFGTYSGGVFTADSSVSFTKAVDVNLAPLVQFRATSFIGSSSQPAGTSYALNLTGFGDYLGSVKIYAVGPIPAVPEASSLAMSLAGLGVVGLIARRRKTA